MSHLPQLRRRLFVNPEIQSPLLSRLSMYWLGYHLILWHALFLADWMRSQVSAIASGGSVSVLSAYLNFLANDHLLPLVALAIFPLVFWDMLKVSHRFVGPLVQVRNRLLDMANGCPPQRVQFRRNDLLSEIQNAFNAYVDSLQAEERDRDEVAGQSEEQYARLVQQIKALQEAMHQHSKGQPDAEPDLALAAMAEEPMNCEG